MSDRPDIRFNNARGAVLCSKCRIILKEDLTREEYALTEPQYCGNNVWGRFESCEHRHYCEDCAKPILHAGLCAMCAECELEEAMDPETTAKEMDNEGV